MKKYAKNIAIIVFLIFIAISIYLISSTYMMAPDEYNYSHIPWTSTKLSGFHDIVTSEMSMYQQWTGRIPVHTIIQSMLYLGTWIYQLLNPIIFIVFVLLICNVLSSKWSYFKICLAMFLIVFEVKGLGEKFIWLSGSVNYLWTTTLMLLVMYYYYAFFEKDKKLNIGKSILLWIISFFAGWSQENVVFALGSFIIVIGISNFKNFLKMDKKQKFYIITSVLLFGIGAMLLIFAPGNFKRLDTNESKIQITNIITNFKQIGNLIGIYIISIFGVGFVRLSKEQIDKKDKIWKNQIMILLSICIALLPMVIIAEFPTRAMLPYETMIIVLTVSNSEYIIENVRRKKIIALASLLITIAVGYELYANVIIAQKCMKPYKEKVSNEISSAQNSGEKEVILSKFEEGNLIATKRINFLVDYSPKTIRTNIINTYMTIYYGFDSIEAIGKEEMLVKIYFDEKVPNINYNIINTQNGEIVRQSIIEENDESTNLVTFVMLKSENGLLKIELPQEIKDKVNNVKLCTISEKQEINQNDIIE